MASQDLYRVVLADDHALYRYHLKRVLLDNGDIEVIGEAADGVELLDVLCKNTPPPHMVIADIAMPRLGGIEAAASIKHTYPGMKVLILSMHREADYVQEALSAGASGYLLKEDTEAELFPAIEAIRESGTYLSLRLRRPENL